MRLSLAVLIILTVLSASNNWADSSGSWTSKNWGLNNSLAKSHISAEKAWPLLTESRRIVVAELDTGIQLTHQDLPNISRFGFDFVNQSKIVRDWNGHGTHVAGIIEAVSHGHALIVPIRYFSNSNTGHDNLVNTVKAFKFAVDHGAKIINYSGGGPEFSEDEYLAIKYAAKRGVLVVAAAGNEKSNSDLAENYYYPAAYGLSNVITVMATDIRNNRLTSSNWGAKKVDVAAPGENIYSTLPDGKYGYMSGTSQATAFVSGIAAAILSQRPELTPQEVKEIIMETVDPLPQLEGKCVSEGRVNEFEAVKMVKSYTKVRP